MALGILLGIGPSIPADFRSQVFGQTVDHRPTDSVKSAGDFIRTAAELSSGVQSSHYSFQGGFSGGWVDIYGDATTVVLNRDYTFGIQFDFYQVTKASHGLIDGVIENFVDQVMQTALVGAADVHTRADSNRFQSLKDLDIFRSVVGIGLLLHIYTSY
jgi:hypothetical protein